MSTVQVTGAALRRYTVRGLAKQPLVGASCCAVPGAFLIEELVREVPGIVSASVSETEGLLVVSSDGSNPRLVDEVIAAVERAGYRASVPAESRPNWR